MSEQKYLRRPEVETRYQIATSTLYHLMNRGLFPRPVRLGAKIVAWDIADLQAHEARLSASRQSAAA